VKNSISVKSFAEKVEKKVLCIRKNQKKVISIESFSERELELKVIFFYEKTFFLLGKIEALHTPSRLSSFPSFSLVEFDYDVHFMQC
jgi:hypothetical protein